ncbi:MAG: hypothetical protein U9P38_09330 [Campylobacterota bacterium]|nr:hypothetical protein [Campylobacterota bacterium]
MITKEQLAEAMLDLKESQKQMGLDMQKSQDQFRVELKESQEQFSIEMKKSQEKSDKRVDKIAKLIGNILNNQGDIAEEFFYNSLADKPTLAGISYDFIEPNAHRRKDGVEDEYDILLVNGKDVAIIETKYKAHSSDIEKLIDKKYDNFKKLYPEYKNYRHHLGLASFNMNKDVKEMASKHNVILLQRKGELIETIVPFTKN